MDISEIFGEEPKQIKITRAWFDGKSMRKTHTIRGNDLKIIIEVMEKISSGSSFEPLPLMPGSPLIYLTSKKKVIMVRIDDLVYEGDRMIGRARGFHSLLERVFLPAKVEEVAPVNEVVGALP